MHEKLFWGLPYCVLSPDRWLTMWWFFFPFGFFPPCPNERRDLLGRAAETRLGKGTRRRELLASTPSIQSGQPSMTMFSNRVGGSDQVKSNSLEFCPSFFSRPTARLVNLLLFFCICLPCLLEISFPVPSLQLSKEFTLKPTNPEFFRHH